MKPILSSVLFAVAAVAVAADNPATKPVPRDGNWMKRHESFVERAKKGDVDVLFVGDSITQGWEGNGKEVWAEQFKAWKPMNLGIGGDRTQHVLWRITTGKELEGIDPKVVVLMIGTNNTGSDTPEQIAEGVEAIVKEFRKQKPKAKIALLAVFPRSGKGAKDLKDPNTVAADELHKKIPAINEKLAKLDDGKMVKFVNINKSFLNDAGGLPKSIMPDYLHLSKDGYARWAKAIAPTVNDLLKH
jgi:lysophospholipase L1-like esterase